MLIDLLLYLDLQMANGSDEAVKNGSDEAVKKGTVEAVKKAAKTSPEHGLLCPDGCKCPNSQVTLPLTFLSRVFNSLRLLFFAH